MLFPAAFFAWMVRLHYNCFADSHRLILTRSPPFRTTPPFCPPTTNIIIPALSSCVDRHFAGSSIPEVDGGPCRGRLERASVADSASDFGFSHACSKALASHGRASFGACCSRAASNAPSSVLRNVVVFSCPQTHQLAEEIWLLPRPSFACECAFSCIGRSLTDMHEVPANWPDPPCFNKLDSES
jgi:hypothetical protein